ncbi:MAG: hypothetical protein A2W25_12155 [candidate division Zixibacteria bacterium RBG_16_53_22]|nr:MAG: hypothetical protein A2W25_12155 [candidate division Zixibacteria bacterium RBG_16_53_22]
MNAGREYSLRSCRIGLVESVHRLKKLHRSTQAEGVGYALFEALEATEEAVRHLEFAMLEEGIEFAEEVYLCPNLDSQEVAHDHE